MSQNNTEGQNQVQDGQKQAMKTRCISEGGENTCSVCHDPILMFAIGPCDHPICHRCSTRMRVLCEKNDCPICRATSPQVAFVYHKQLFKDIHLRNFIPNRKYKIFFEDEDVEDSYLELLEYRCRICPNRRPEKTFAQLQTHMRRDHQLFACDLCVQFLKIFPYERKFYNRKNLAIHRRVGDTDDKSYKGHPLCEFCDQRYHDKDELMKHLRKDHYFCHFCDQQGSNAYYDQYLDLMDHFSDVHYLCTEGECGNEHTQFTHAFASEIDLKAHRAAVHNKKSKEARTLEVDFQLPPRGQGFGRGGDGYSSSRSGHGSRGGDRYNRRRDHASTQEEADFQRALQASRESFTLQSTEPSRPPVAERVPDPVHDFPSLSGAPATHQPQETTPKTPEEDFPSLALSASSNQPNPIPGRKKAVPATNKAYSSVMNPPTQPAPVAVRNEPRPVSLGTVTQASSRAFARVPVSTNNEEEYPSLGGSGTGASRAVSAGAQGSWIVKSSKGGGSTASSVAASKTLTISKVPSRAFPTSSSASFKKPISDENEFPSLGGGKDRSAHPVNPLSQWSTSQNGVTKKKHTPFTPKSERVDDETFELPESYYTSLKDPTESSNITIVEKPPDPVIRLPSKPVPTGSSTKDFPGLPSREKKQPEQAPAAIEKKKKRNNKKARDKENAHGNGLQEESNASLNEIALGLMKPVADLKSKDKPFESSRTKLVSKKPTDWFDSPPEELTEKMTPSQQQQKGMVLNGQHTVSHKQDKMRSNSDIATNNNNFPSLHDMLASVQQPPGFSKVNEVQATSHLPTSLPPGFGPPAASSSGSSLDLKSISSSLTSKPGPPPGFTPSTDSSFAPRATSISAAYIEPPDFKKRNSQLIVNVKAVLETVQEGFSDFCSLSRQFRQGSVEAQDYYTCVRSLMGGSDFDSVFPELLALLPDIGRQQLLYDVHQTASSKSKGRASLCQCPSCGQVTLTTDFQYHRLQHGDTSSEDGVEDFPSLGGGAASSVKMNGAWIKAK